MLNTVVFSAAELIAYLREQGVRSIDMVLRPWPYPAGREGLIVLNDPSEIPRVCSALEDREDIAQVEPGTHLLVAYTVRRPDP